MPVKTILEMAKTYVGNVIHACLFYSFNPKLLVGGMHPDEVIQGFSVDWREKLKKHYLPLFREVSELLESDIVVLDVGARGRTLARQWGGLTRKVRFYGFELSTEAECKKMAEEDGAIGIRSTYVPYAVSGRRESRAFHVKRKMTGSSFYDNSFAEHIYTNWRVVRNGSVLDQRSRSEILRTLEVNTVSLDGLLEDGLFKQVDLVKVDAEGAELEILEGAAKVLEKSLAVQLEIDFVQRYNPKNHFFRIDELLHGHGLSLFDFPRFLKAGRRRSPLIVNEIRQYHVDSAGQMIGADVIYLRDPDGPECVSNHQLPVESLIKLSIISFVSGQIEFAMGILRDLSMREDRVKQILEQRQGL